jgi:predicted O-methyltransferase YrrM
MIALETFGRTDDLADLPQGWFNHGEQVMRLIEHTRPKVVVELGTWLGASAIAMARSVQRWGGTVTCIDTWAGEMDEDAVSLGGKTPLMLVSCARAMVEAGVGANVRLIPALTQHAAWSWTQPIDFLYVDAGHSYEAVKADLDAWAPFVKPGGLIAGDDYDHPRYPGVKRAWDEFEQAHGLDLMRYQSDPPRKDGICLVYGTTQEQAHG